MAAGFGGVGERAGQVVRPVECAASGRVRNFLLGHVPGVQRVVSAVLGGCLSDSSDSRGRCTRSPPRRERRLDRRRSAPGPERPWLPSSRHLYCAPRNAGSALGMIAEGKDAESQIIFLCPGRSDRNFAIPISARGVEIAGRKVIGIHKNAWHMRVWILRIHCVRESVPVFGEALDEIQSVAQHKDCETSAQWLAQDEFQQLLACGRLVVDLHIKEIEKQHIERSPLRTGRHVHESIRRKIRGSFREGAGNGIEVVNVERTNPLRFSIFGDREVGGCKARNRLPIRVSDDDIDYDSAHALR